MSSSSDGYFGSFPSVLDEAGRITVPKRFRENMDSKDHRTWWVAPGLNGNLYLYHRASWEAYLERNKAAEEAGDQEAHELLSFIYGNSYETKVDGQGRMVIPPPLRPLLSLGEDQAVMVSGVKDRIEVCERGTWEARQQRLWPGFGQRFTEFSKQFGKSGSGSEKGEQGHESRAE